MSYDTAFKIKVSEVFRELIDRQQVVTCINCIQWNDHDEKCTLAKIRPPARVIVFGCPAWEEDIPF